ncbi:hypothetical protein F3Y22_tig00111792pilonHSYRG00127 [Hibiscus syriacus]|uniref:Uncharacterized protein n=1 Tax=Hibiscus syriacus TaxID=106335 RepID=A0A6A2Y0B1_HIBSY|nr:hypothetical protein F3Y22_tig00111792pilonHSYRG00127 [Hibiscus syriacus]
MILVLDMHLSQGNDVRIISDTILAGELSLNVLIELSRRGTLLMGQFFLKSMLSVLISVVTITLVIFAVVHRIRNHIRGITGSDGTWIDLPDLDVYREAVHYFASLFQTPHPQQSTAIMNSVLLVVTPAMNSALLDPYTKVIVNLLKPILSACVDDNQAAFVLVESNFRKRPPNYEMPSVGLDPTTSRRSSFAIPFRPSCTRSVLVSPSRTGDWEAARITRECSWTADFSLILCRDRVLLSVRGWSKHLLSYGGRGFHKGGWSSYPMYSVGCFLLPEGLINEITCALRDFGWSGKLDVHGWPLISWSSIYQSKRLGGLGLRDLHTFNIALLGNQRVEAPSVPSSLVSRVLSAKYFPSGDLFSATLRVFTEADANLILQCSMVPVASDVRIWEGHSTGVYSARSGYHWLMRASSSPTVATSLWLFLSQLPTLLKVHLFGWRLAHEVLPVGSRLAMAGLSYGCKPGRGVLKVNVDRACPSPPLSPALGVIVRDDHGLVLSVFARLLVDHHDPSIVEGHALVEGIRCAVYYSIRCCNCCGERLEKPGNPTSLSDYRLQASISLLLGNFWLIILPSKFDFSVARPIRLLIPSHSGRQRISLFTLIAHPQERALTGFLLTGMPRGGHTFAGFGDTWEGALQGTHLLLIGGRITFIEVRASRGLSYSSHYVFAYQVDSPTQLICNDFTSLMVNPTPDVMPSSSIGRHSSATVYDLNPRGFTNNPYGSISSTSRGGGHTSGNFFDLNIGLSKEPSSSPEEALHEPGTDGAETGLFVEPDSPKFSVHSDDDADEVPINTTPVELPAHMYEADYDTMYEPEFPDLPNVYNYGLQSSVNDVDSGRVTSIIKSSMTSTLNFDSGLDSMPVNKFYFFNGANYAYWKNMMMYFIQASDMGAWNTVEDGYIKPLTYPRLWTEGETRMFQLNSKAIHIIFVLLD